MTTQNPQKERDAEYYNHGYHISPTYKLSPEKMPYYEMWVAARKIVERENPHTIIDLGCGPGHFGKLIYDSVIDKTLNVKNFYGI